MIKKFYKCEKCGKNLIERLSSGLWKFCFGRQKNMEVISSDVAVIPVVEMVIKGSVRMKCIRRDCGHYTILPYFPNSKDFQEDPQSDN